MILNHQFKAFDTEIELCVVASADDFKSLIGKIEQSAENFEKRFSRFDEFSELSKINNKITQEIKISEEMLKVLLKSKEAYQMTAGIFDPTIYNVLRASGYDKSFDSITNSDAYINEQFELKKYSFKELIINEKTKSIKLPVGMKIDLGGIAKGYWVDQMKELLDQDCSSYWLSAGGDIFFRGVNESSENWQVALQNPLKLDENLLYLNISEEGYGVATSGVTKRQGIKNGKKWSHLIDPRQNTRVKNTVLAVTVIAKSTTDADVMAKTVLILGIRKGLALVNSNEDYECVIVDNKLKMHISRDLKKFL